MFCPRTERDVIDGTGRAVTGQPLPFRQMGGSDGPVRARSVTFRPVQSLGGPLEPVGGARCFLSRKDRNMIPPPERYPAPNPEFFTEFEKKYPPDAHGEEASPNARVWRVYRDRVTELDDDLLEGWHKTLDVLLIFVGLFSAIATAFIIEAYKGLQPDYGEITARGVVALLAQSNTSLLHLCPFPASITSTQALAPCGSMPYGLPASPSL
ncbi:hypothetical protein BKA62DRAFT_161835 [Auriculariales sp. MPI-PUGE-AT-0066]|nr:hypothetical protein BKA62DRAFT_161835 [Auriculariales sp. MPI-PUGE-AT-0066]